MPIPATETEVVLQTPEVFSQKSLVGDGSVDLNASPTNIMEFLNLPSPADDKAPYGSNAGAEIAGKFDLESVNDLKNPDIDDILSPLPDDLLKSYFNFDNLPFSSQEQSVSSDLDNLFKPDASMLRMPVEEQNDAGVPFAFLPASMGVNKDTGDVKPDIVNTAFENAMSLPSAFVSTDDALNNAPVYIMDSSSFGTIDSEQLGLFTIIDSSTVSAAAPCEPAVQLTPAAEIPVTVLASDELPLTSTGASTSVAALENCATADSTQGRGTTGRKRRAPPSTIDDDEEWNPTGDAGGGGNETYAEKRRRNNVAVRKSRAKAKERQKMCEGEVDRLKAENETLSRKVEMLERECSLLRELFGKVGINMPNLVGKISCEFLCPSSGIFKDPFSCKNYYRCGHQGEPGVRLFCGDGQAWNNDIGACDLPYNVDCQDVRVPGPYYSGPEAEIRSYELRRYTVKPEAFHDFISYINDCTRLPTGLFLVGSWFVESGSNLNEVYALWQFDTFSGRDKVDGPGRMGYPKTQHRISHHLSQMVVSEESTILATLPTWGLENTDIATGLYTLRIYDFQPDSGWQQPFSNVLHIVEDILTPFGGNLLGVFQSSFGQLNQAFLLWQYTSMEERAKGVGLIGANPSYQAANAPVAPRLVSQKAMVLRPTRCSPLQ